MLRLATLLSFAMIASGQLPERPAFLWIQTAANGDLHATLTVSVSPAPLGLPAVLAHSIGCDLRGLDKSSIRSRIVVACPAEHRSALRFHSAVRLAELGPSLSLAGVEMLDLAITTPHFPSLRLDPAIPEQSSRWNGSYHTKYSVDQLPEEIVIDGGFEISQVRTLAAAGLGLILAPFLLFVPRPRDALRLHAQREGILVLSWICWIWVLLRVGAGPLLNYVFGHWSIAPLLVLMAPPLASVWIGSRLSAAEYGRLIPNGIGVDYYRQLKFWSGAAGVCLASTMLYLLLLAFDNTLGPMLFGIFLALACVLRIKSLSRGGRHQLSDGDLRKRMFALAAKAGVKLRGVSILTSPTPRPPAAFATRWGVVMLNQPLLENLSRREVDAIVCHEFSHLRPVKRSALTGVYVLLVASILGFLWIPNFSDFVPPLLLIIYFLIKRWKRSGEYQADLDSVRWSGDPEAMITGLARVSHASGMPLSCGVPVSWMMAHPATMDRIHAIARAGGLQISRVEELLAESQRDPADHYVEAETASVPGDIAYSPALRQRMQTRLTWYSLLSPVVLGLPSAWLLERFGLTWWAVLIVGSLVSMIAIKLGSSWIAGSVWGAVKQRALARCGLGVFAGFSPSAEPRMFDGSFLYDMGIVRFANEGLEFAGDRARFTLDRRLIERVWLGDGPRHWTPRKVLYIECRPSPDGGSMIFSLQALDAWLWPSTFTAVKRLQQSVEDWLKVPSSSPVPPAPCPLPRVEGSPNTFIAFRTALRALGIYAGIAFFLVSVKIWFEGSMGIDDRSAVLTPVAICCMLSLFLMFPRLQWSRLKTLPDAPSSVPADS